jgi:DNA invertase Pin-like site-specific DNA recombinase
MFSLIEAGDIVIVTSIDRIAGSLVELLTTLKRVRAKDCHFRSLAEPWADSMSSTGALTLTILEALANLDRNLKRRAAAEGRFEAKSKGTHMGRPSKLTLGQRHEAIARREAGEPLAAIARSYGVSRTTIKRLSFQT